MGTLLGVHPIVPWKKALFPGAGGIGGVRFPWKYGSGKVETPKACTVRSQDRQPKLPWYTLGSYKINIDLLKKMVGKK